MDRRCCNGGMLMRAQHYMEEQSEEVPASSQLPQLPPEVWGAIARAALDACGRGLRSWLTFRRVSRSWRQGLEGAVYMPLWQANCRLQYSILSASLQRAFSITKSIQHYQVQQHGAGSTFLMTSHTRCDDQNYGGLCQGALQLTRGNAPAGSTVNTAYCAPLTPAEWQWLRTTSAEFHSVIFDPNDDGTVFVQVDPNILVSRCELYAPF